MAERTPSRPERTPNRRAVPEARGEGLKQWGLLALLALLGLGGGAGLRAWRTRHGLGSAGGSSDGEMFAGSKLSQHAAGIWNKLLAALGLHGARRFTTADLAALLQAHGGDPLAQAFAGEFRDDPQLMEIWKEFERNGDVAWLARRFTDSRRFIELLNRHAADPRFAALAALFASDLEGALAHSRTGEGASPIKSGEPIGSARAVRGGGPVQGKGPVQWRPAVLGGPGATEAGPMLLAGAGPARGETPVPAGDRQEDREDRAGPEHHGVDWKLKDTIVRAGQDRNLFNLIDSLFTKMAKPDRDFLINLCSTRGLCDPLAACSTSDALYESCRVACAANPGKCRLVFPPRPQPPDCAVNPGDPRCEIGSTSTETGSQTATQTDPNDGGEDATATDTYAALSRSDKLELCGRGDMTACAKVCHDSISMFLPPQQCAAYQRQLQERLCQQGPCLTGCPQAQSESCKCERDPCADGCSKKPGWCVDDGGNP